MEEKSLLLTYQVVRNDEWSAADRQLIERAKAVALSSYAPYSHFHVGAALRLADGTISCGSNQENLAYPSGLCAERVALFAAGANHAEIPVQTLAVAAWDETAFLQTPVLPCGACRQVMAETELRFGTPMRLLLYGSACSYIIRRASDLLPLAFRWTDGKS